MPLDNAGPEQPRLVVDRRGPAEVIDIVAAARSRGADVYTHHARQLRAAAAQLADSAKKLDAHSRSMQRSLDKMSVHRQTLKAEAARGRRIAEQAGRIEAAINAGDMAALHAIQAEASGKML
jgi:hypothetical protein